MNLPMMNNPQVVSVSEITCPYCGYRHEETMPEDTCTFFYRCENCQQMMRPKAGDCCVFCSYGSMRCPSKQLESYAGY